MGSSPALLPRPEPPGVRQPGDARPSVGGGANAELRPRGR